MDNEFETFTLFYLYIKEFFHAKKNSCDITTWSHGQINGKRKLKKSHTCEEGGANLSISFWHLFMNLKNKLLKKLLK